MTEYVVLRKRDDGWRDPLIPASTVSARSARAAIEVIAEKLKEEGAGEFVAVPARSWKPVTVKVETKTALKFS